MCRSIEIRVVLLLYMVTRPQTYTALQSDCYCVIFKYSSVRVDENTPADLYGPRVWAH